MREVRVVLFAGKSRVRSGSNCFISYKEPSYSKMSDYLLMMDVTLSEDVITINCEVVSCTGS